MRVYHFRKHLASFGAPITYSVVQSMSHVPKHIKITFSQIVTEMQGHQKWQLDQNWFYKLLCDSLLNSLLQTWVLKLPIGQEIGTGVPPGKSLIVIPPYEGVPHCLYKKADPPPPLALKNKSPIFMGERIPCKPYVTLGIQKPGIFTMLEYSEPWHIYNPTHIENLLNDSWCSALQKQLTAVIVFPKCSILELWRASKCTHSWISTH